MTADRKTLERWFIKAPNEFPWWKALIWKCLGVKRVGYDSGYKCTAYYFNGIYYVSKIEEESE